MRHNIYLFSGTQYNMVKPSAMRGVFDFYRDLGVSDAHLVFVNMVPAGHAFISPTFGGACGANAIPAVNRCTTVKGKPYDQPHALLNQLYGTLKPRASKLSSTLQAFDQTAYAPASAGMAKTGYVYIPSACTKNSMVKCAVHVVFHGCLQSANVVGDAVYRKVGYNAWADSNHMIVLYPQVDPPHNPFTPSLNLQGCWDCGAPQALIFKADRGHN